MIIPAYVYVPFGILSVLIVWYTYPKIFKGEDTKSILSYLWLFFAGITCAGFFHFARSEQAFSLSVHHNLFSTIFCAITGLAIGIAGFIRVGKKRKTPKGF